MNFALDTNIKNATFFVVSLSLKPDIDYYDFEQFLCIHGSGVDVNWKFIYKHYDNDNTLIGLFIKGFMYVHGYYVVRDMDKGLQYLELAREKKHVFSSLILGIIYLSEERDYLQIKTYFDDAIKYSNNDVNILKLISQKIISDSCRLLFEYARNCFEKAVKLKDPTAMNDICKFYTTLETSCYIDKKKALEHYLYAFEHHTEYIENDYFFTNKGDICLNKLRETTSELNAMKQFKSNYIKNILGYNVFSYIEPFIYNFYLFYLFSKIRNIRIHKNTYKYIREFSSMPFS